MHHVAILVEESEFDAVIADLAGKGHPVIAAQMLSIARVAYCDTAAAIGVATEIIGLTEAEQGRTPWMPRPDGPQHLRPLDARHPGTGVMPG